MGFSTVKSVMEFFYALNELVDCSHVNAMISLYVRLLKNACSNTHCIPLRERQILLIFSRSQKSDRNFSSAVLVQGKRRLLIS